MTFQELLIRDKSVSDHHKYFQMHATKLQHGIVPKIMNIQKKIRHIALKIPMALKQRISKLSIVYQKQLRF